MTLVLLVLLVLLKLLWLVKLLGLLVLEGRRLWSSKCVATVSYKAVCPHTLVRRLPRCGCTFTGRGNATSGS